MYTPHTLETLVRSIEAGLRSGNYSSERYDADVAEPVLRVRGPNGALYQLVVRFDVHEGDDPADLAVEPETAYDRACAARDTGDPRFDVVGASTDGPAPARVADFVRPMGVTSDAEHARRRRHDVERATLAALRTFSVRSAYPDGVTAAEVNACAKARYDFDATLDETCAALCELSALSLASHDMPAGNGNAPTRWRAAPWSAEDTF
jgi:hypothetical protein